MEIRAWRRAALGIKLQIEGDEHDDGQRTQHSESHTVTLGPVLYGPQGIHVVQTPCQAPNANAYAERFVRSLKAECLDRMIPIGERHFRRAITKFVDHYHRERNHQGVANELLIGAPATVVGRVRRRARLGGLLNFYERAA